MMLLMYAEIMALLLPEASGYVMWRRHGEKSLLTIKRVALSICAICSMKCFHGRHGMKYDVTAAAL